MGVLIAIAFLFLMLYLARAAHKDTERKHAAWLKQVLKNEPLHFCPPHKWTYDTNNRLYCAACQSTPGAINADQR